MRADLPRDKAVLSCRGLAVGYKDSPIITDINLDFEAGQFITLLGPNGTGKTTLLRTLSRHLEPMGGSIYLNGRPLNLLRQAELARLMAVVLTDRVTPPLFNVFQFVALGRYPHTNFLGRLTARDQRVIAESLSAVHADELGRRDFASLSDGECQKVLVARALAQEPRILLLDEPTAHLDLKHRIEVMAILRDLCRSKGITVISSLHDVDIAAKVSDRVALIKNGAVIDWGCPEEVLNGRAVSSLYDFEAASFSHHLGSIELRGNGQRGLVFVLGGMGSGAAVYRLLAKGGYAVSTGVLQSNDLDCYVARSLGADCVSQPPAAAMSENSMTAAWAKIKQCDLMIDAGGDNQGPYQSNIALLKKAVAHGTPVFSLRPAGTENRSSDVKEARIIRVKSASRLLDTIEEL
ncbi:MAG TPA: ABC transporter ATP-binding protein [Desulfobacterales bacterium]|nr:ABC transporter ATP-binding protein [Desulfobacterales bacterium]